MRRVLGTLGVLAATVTCVSAVTSSGATSPRVSKALEFDSPSGLAVAAGHLWVTNEAGNSVSEIDPSNGAWTATFTRARGYRFNRPTAITPAGADLFIANAAGTVLEMRATTGALVRVIPNTHAAFADPVAISHSGDVILVLNAGRASSSSPLAGSITELDARTGSVLRTIKGSAFAFDDPAAMTVSGPDVFVADKGNNSVTEVAVASGRLVRVVAGEGLDAPDGIAVQDGNVWVSDSAANSATEINAVSGQAVVTETDSDGQYGFGAPLMAIGTGGYVYIASPYGTSPMVTKLSATSGQPSWYMCNTNGPYYFSNLSAFALDGGNLWVASRTGANSQTPGASTGSLTELSTGSGALIMTLPLPPPSTTTTTTTTTTTP
jgi:sugar lactone lactonase YvrE